MGLISTFMTYLGPALRNLGYERGLIICRWCRRSSTSGAISQSDYRHDKAIPSARDCLDAASVRSAAIEHLAQRRDLGRQIAVLDNNPRPDGHHDLILCNEIAVPPHQQDEQVEGARAERYRDKGAVLICAEQAAGPRSRRKSSNRKISSTASTSTLRTSLPRRARSHLFAVDFPLFEKI